MSKERRKLARWLGAVHLTLAAVALGAAVRAESMELEMWTTEAQPERQAAIGYLMDAFAAFHDDVRVQVVAFDENAISAALAAARREGGAPDIVHAGADTIIALAARGALDRGLATAIMDRLGPERFALGARRMLRDAATGAFDGVPFHGWLQGLVYRADWFAEAGLPPPRTWEDILTAAERLHDPARGRYGILIGTEADSYAQQVFTHLALGNGVRIIDRAGRLVFDSPETVETLAFVKQLAAFAPPGAHTPRARDYYLQGRLAMMFYSTFIMDDLALPEIAADSLTGANFSALEGAAFDPDLLSNTRTVTRITNRRPASFGAVSALGLFATEDPARRAAVARLVLFLFNPDVYIAWLHMAPGGMLPVLPEVANEDMLYRDLTGVLEHYGRARLKAILQGMDGIETFGAVSEVRRPEASVILDGNIIGEMVHRVIHEGMPPADAVSRASARMRALLAQQGRSLR
ncbi:MAG: ABC transporter substrate-binding protein [Alphaproteobacteria bacterium]